jgi:hypothetical protein
MPRPAFLSQKREGVTSLFRFCKCLARHSFRKSGKELPLYSAFANASPGIPFAKAGRSYLFIPLLQMPRPASFRKSGKELPSYSDCTHKAFVKSERNYSLFGFTMRRVDATGWAELSQFETFRVVLFVF